MNKLPEQYEYEIEEILEKQPNQFLTGNPSKRNLRASRRWRKILGNAKRYLTIGSGRKLILVLLLLIPILLISMNSNGFLSATLWIIVIFLTIKYGAAFVNPNQSYEKKWRGRTIERNTRSEGINNLLNKMLGRRRP